jgi:predicted RNase H-like nuclease
MTAMSSPAVVLGIDSAWGTREPSGVALVRRDLDGWHCLSVAPSYESFVAMTARGHEVDWSIRPTGGEANIDSLLEAAAIRAGQPPNVVCLDLPLSRDPIVARRAADQQISQAYGSRLCSAHSPTAGRPGPLGDRLHKSLARHGYRLITANDAHVDNGVLLEVYPHPAIVELLSLERRLEYKVSRSNKFWPRASVAERRRMLLDNLQRLHDGLFSRLGRLQLDLPSHEQVGTLSELKRYEDALDAIVCCWVGVRYLARSAKAFGGDRDAIWCPVAPGSEPV